MPGSVIGVWGPAGMWISLPTKEGAGYVGGRGCVPRSWWEEATTTTVCPFLLTFVLGFRILGLDCSCSVTVILRIFYVRVGYDLCDRIFHVQAGYDLCDICVIQ